MKKIFEKKLNNLIYQIFDDRPSHLDYLEVEQVHGKKILTTKEISQDNCADGIIGHNNGETFAIKTADCLPVVVIGKKGHALIHAGWRGVHQKVVTCQKVKNIDPFYFFIGPHIQQKSFEVQEDFFSYFEDKSLYQKIDEKLFFSLSDALVKDIYCKFKNVEIEVSDIDTFTNLSFNSYRRDKTKKRNWNILQS